LEGIKRVARSSDVIKEVVISAHLEKDYADIEHVLIRIESSTPIPRPQTRAMEPEPALIKETISESTLSTLNLDLSLLPSIPTGKLLQLYKEPLSHEFALRYPFIFMDKLLMEQGTTMWDQCEELEQRGKPKQLVYEKRGIEAVSASQGSPLPHRFTLESIQEYEELWRKLTLPFKNMVDIGHADGGLLLMLSLLNVGKRCVGVEYIKSRVLLSWKLEARVREFVPQVDILFELGDGRTWLPNIIVEMTRDVCTLVYMNNLMWAATECLTSDILQNLSMEYMPCSLLSTETLFRRSRYA